MHDNALRVWLDLLLVDRLHLMNLCAGACIHIPNNIPFYVECKLDRRTCIHTVVHSSPFTETHILNNRPAWIFLRYNTLWKPYLLVDISHRFESKRSRDIFQKKWNFKKKVFENVQNSKTFFERFFWLFQFFPENQMWRVPTFLTGSFTFTFAQTSLPACATRGCADAQCRTFEWPRAEFGATRTPKPQVVHHEVAGNCELCRSCTLHQL